MRTFIHACILIPGLTFAAKSGEDKGTVMNFNPKVSLTPAECQAHGLPPLTITMDLTGAALMQWPFWNGDTYFTLSGPPGGPCHMSLRVVRSTDGKLPTLEELVKANDRPGQNFARLGDGTVKVCGKDHAAIAYVVKPTPWADRCAAVLIPLSKSPDALLLTFSASHDAKTGITPGASQQRALNSLTIAEN